MVVLFLTTSVISPDEHDWVELKRVLKYLKVTKHKKRKLRVESLSVGNYWIGESYSTHYYCRGHTGYMVILGRPKNITQGLV